jgi:hypothetical protein
MDRYLACARVYGRLDGCNSRWIDELLRPLIQEDLVIVLDGPTFDRPDDVPDKNEQDLEFSRAIDMTYRETAALYGWEIVQTVPAPDPDTSVRLTYLRVLELAQRVLGDRIQTHQFHLRAA